MGMHLIDVPLMGVHLMGMHLMDVPLMGVHLIAPLVRLWWIIIVCGAHS
jgi:hypothetical protein